MKYLHLMRIKHWMKNLLIFFPLICSRQICDSDVCLLVVKGVLAFCMAASAVYVFNDLKDMERDRMNPKKQHRPLASGAVTKKAASVLLALLVLTDILLFCSGRLGMRFWICLIVYLLINIGYSMGLKNVPILDVAILSGGYILRLYSGGELAGVEISDWMFLTVASASLYLGFGKRRNELIRYGDKGRKLLERYTVGFLDKGIQMSLTLTVVFYALSCTDENTVMAGANLLWSVLLVILVLLRYNMLLEDGTGDGDPVEVLLQDKALMLLIIFYVVSVCWFIY